MSITLKETKDLDYERVVDLFFSVQFLHHAEREKYTNRRLRKHSVIRNMSFPLMTTVNL